MQRSVDLETKLLSRNFSKKKNRTQDTILLFWLFFGRSFGFDNFVSRFIDLGKRQIDCEDFAIFCGLLRKHFKELMKVEELLEQMVMVQLELVELVDFPKENNFES